MDQIYANYNSIIGIYIHELAYIPISNVFAHFLAELLTLRNFCHLCHLSSAALKQERKRERKRERKSSALWSTLIDMTKFPIKKLKVDQEIIPRGWIRII